MGPGGEGLGAAGPEVCGGVVVSAAGEHIGDLIMGGEEALNLPRRLEPLHDPLSSSGRLMGVFGPVIEALVLPMLDPGHDLPLGSGVALQLVSDKHTRCAPLLLEDLAEQAFGGLLVTPALDENIENEPVLVDGTPEPMLLPGDADDDLIEVPLDRKSTRLNSSHRCISYAVFCLKKKKIKNIQLDRFLSTLCHNTGIHKSAY